MIVLCARKSEFEFGDGGEQINWGFFLWGISFSWEEKKRKEKFFRECGSREILR